MGQRLHQVTGDIDGGAEETMVDGAQLRVGDIVRGHRLGRITDETGQHEQRGK
jgi:hypothetical protein